MKITLPKLICIFTAAVLLLACCTSCSKAKEPTAAENAKKEELAQGFMAELRDVILPIRSNPTLLRDAGLFVSEEEKVPDTALLEEFVALYKAGRDCSITIAFVTKAFVVARLEVVDGSGYYFRYQFNSKEPIAVTSKMFDSAALTEDERYGKIMLKLQYDDVEIGTFTFRPPTGEEDAMPPPPESST